MKKTIYIPLDELILIDGSDWDAADLAIRDYISDWLIDNDIDENDVDYDVAFPSVAVTIYTNKSERTDK